MLQAQSLTTMPKIRHGFFTRKGGVSSGLYASLNCGLGSNDDRAAVLENRARVARAMDVPHERLVNAYQVHSAECRIVEAPWVPEDAPRLDALATRMPGIALAVASADCAPLLFADPEAGVVGAAHAGWRGAVGGVAEATLDAMVRLGADRSRILAAIGPTISAAAYEVGPDFIDAAAEADPASARFLRPAARAGHAMFDLPAYLCERLMRAGVATVEDCGLCTYSNEAELFSYRRATHQAEPDYGRHFSAIVLSA